MMVHAQVGDEFYDLALQHAWKVFDCLPVRGLEINGRPATPYELFFGVKPQLERFKVLFCPVVVNIGDKTGNEGPTVRHRKNTAERGVKGIHVGISMRSQGWLIYIPALNNTVVSTDVAFDECFLSTLVKDGGRTRFKSGIPLQPHPQATQQSDQIEVTGNSLSFGQGWEEYPTIGDGDPFQILAEDSDLDHNPQDQAVNNDPDDDSGSYDSNATESSEES